jgi:hypothetical protein
VRSERCSRERRGREGSAVRELVTNGPGGDEGDGLTILALQSPLWKSRAMTSACGNLSRTVERAE